MVKILFILLKKYFVSNIRWLLSKILANFTLKNIFIVLTSLFSVRGILTLLANLLHWLGLHLFQLVIILTRLANKNFTLLSFIVSVLATIKIKYRLPNILKYLLYGLQMLLVLATFNAILDIHIGSSTTSSSFIKEFVEGFKDYIYDTLNSILVVLEKFINFLKKLLDYCFNTNTYVGE